MKQRADGRWLKVKRINGKNISFYSKAKTERSAIKDIETQMLRYIEETSKARTFEYYADLWQGEHRERVSYKTWQGYKTHYDRAAEEFGEILIKDIQTSDV